MELTDQQELGSVIAPRVSRPRMTILERVIHLRAEREATLEAEAKQKKTVGKREKMDMTAIADLVGTLMGDD